MCDNFEEGDSMICPHCEVIVTHDDVNEYWTKQAELTEKRLKEQRDKQ